MSLNNATCLVCHMQHTQHTRHTHTAHTWLIALLINTNVTQARHDIWDLWPVGLTLRIRTVVPLPPPPTASAVCRPLSINWRVNWLNLPQSKRQQKKKENAMRIAQQVFRSAFLASLVLSLSSDTLWLWHCSPLFSVFSLIRQAPFRLWAVGSGRGQC